MKPTTAYVAWSVAGLGAAIALAAACGPSGFQSETVIDSVRVLASRVDADDSYAKPGDVVTLETLTVDGRKDKTPPAVTYWIPFVCTNPVDDLYYACFAPFLGADAGTGGGAAIPSFDAGAAEDAGGATDASAGSDGGAGAGDASAPPVLTPVIPIGALAGLLTPGTDITPYLPTGPFTFQIPANIIAGHQVEQGIDPYGLAIVFNIACAGHVKVVGVSAANGPQQVPIGCFDDAGNALGPDDYVIGFTRVYVSTTKANANPRIAGFLFNGTESTTNDAGTANPSPISVTIPACHGSCDAVNIDMDVPTSSWSPGAKSIWVDYYAAGGSVSGEARLLYDISAGKTADPKNPITYQPPDDPGPATIWAVVHDSMDGVTWLQVNVVAK